MRNYPTDYRHPDKHLRRGPNLFFKYFYFLFGPGLFYPLWVIATVQFFFGTLVGQWSRKSAKKILNLGGHPKGLKYASPKKEIKIFEK